MHASNLVAAIKKIKPEISFFGLGGEKLQQQGVRLYYNIVELAVVGIFEILKNLNKFKRIFDGLLKEADREKPDLAILVDYPGFNIRLAAELKKRNIPVVYYISPQIWAWGEKRINTIKKVVDLMIVVFKFEEGLYRKNSVPACFAGHPLIDTVKTTISKDAFNNKIGAIPEVLTISLLPGSREKEVKTLLPIMLESAKLIHRDLNKDAQFIILRSKTVEENIFHQIIKKHPLPVRIITDMTYDGLGSSDFAIVASGTATLETAILGIPMVILYKVSTLTYLYIKALIKIPYIGLVNVIKGEKFVEEFIQYNAKPEKIANYICNILNNEQKLNKIKQGLKDVVLNLGGKGASEKAAEAIMKFLS